MKMKNLLKDSKKVVIIGTAVIAIIIIALAVFLFNKNKTNIIKRNFDAELKELAKGFYEDYYYDVLVGSFGKEYLKKQSESGIVIDLESLTNMGLEQDNKIKDFVNPSTKETCDKNNTKVTIYPTDPYGKTDYKIETKIECNLD